MTKFFITDADAAVCAMDCFASFCIAVSEGNVAKAAFDLVGTVAAIKHSMGV